MILKFVSFAVFVQLISGYAFKDEDLNLFGVNKREIVEDKGSQLLVCKQQPIELGIVLDSSSSITKDDFNKSIAFLQDFLLQFDIGPGINDVRVSMITYGLGIYPDLAFNLTTYSSKEEVISAIGRIDHKQGGHTNTELAIEYMRESQLAESVVRPGVPRVALVITDGESQAWPLTAKEANMSRTDGIKMFAIGVGRKVNKKELLAIAGDESRVSKVDSYDTLNNIKSILAQQICIMKPKPTTLPTKGGTKLTKSTVRPTEIPKPTTTTVRLTEIPKPTTTTVRLTEIPKPTTTTVSSTEIPKPTTTTVRPTEIPKPTTTTVPQTELPELTTTTVPQTELLCKQQPIELGIVLDSSASIGDDDFIKGIVFLKDFLKQFDIGQGTNDVRVSIITYGFGIYTNDAFNLSDHSSKDDVITAIGNIHHMRSNITDTGSGIEYMRESQLAKSMVRQGVPRVGLVVTDGHSHLEQVTVDESKLAREDGINMFAIGVGKNVSIEELISIAGNESRVSNVSTYDTLKNIIKTLAHNICTTELTTTTVPQTELLCKQQPIELGIVLDSSASIADDDFIKGIAFLKDFLQQFDIGQGTNDVRVSIIPYGLGIYTNHAFNLTTYSGKDEAISAIGGIPHEKGSQTDTGDAIKYMRESQLAKSMVRPGVRRVGLVVTDGHSYDGESTNMEANKSRTDGIDMFAIGVSKNVSIEELISIAGNESRVSNVSTYDTLKNIIKTLAIKICTSENKMLLSLFMELSH